MAAELRSSTEELDFQDPNEIKRRRSTLQTQQAVRCYEFHPKPNRETEIKHWWQTVRKQLFFVNLVYIVH